MEKHKNTHITTNELLDRKIFGKGLRNLRRGRGIVNLHDFSKAIHEKTGATIHPNTLRRIEAGDSSVNLSILIAISMTLYREAFSPEIIALITKSVPADKFYCPLCGSKITGQNHQKATLSDLYGILRDKGNKNG